jgi:hypothetical protein
LSQLLRAPGTRLLWKISESKESLRQLRTVVLDAILATDMANHAGIIVEAKGLADRPSG